MAKLYYKAVRCGNRTIEDVPERYRDTVQAMLDEDGEKD